MEVWATLGAATAALIATLINARLGRRAVWLGMGIGGVVNGNAAKIEGLITKVGETTTLLAILKNDNRTLWLELRQIRSALDSLGRHVQDLAETVAYLRG
ncbi:MAG: hypothetical protein DMD60_14725 [Gemmatimonadetes bacterium]|nr:MAG: hypothetical protein DMD60_14725 [Gemmatimonadota bacterium]